MQKTKGIYRSWLISTTTQSKSLKVLATNSTMMRRLRRIKKSCRKYLSQWSEPILRLRQQKDVKYEDVGTHGGVIEVDNEDHCDFVKLRQMLIRTHMEELKEHTNNALYENYRSDKLTSLGVAQDPSVFKEVNPAVKQEEERSLHEAKLQKMETEMKMVFSQKVAEKESKLKQSEEELYARHREMKEQLDRQRLELDDKKARVESGRPLEGTQKKKGFSLGR